MSSKTSPLKLRALVVDDEPLARSNLTVLLRLDSDIETVDECGSGLEAMEIIRSRRPEIVFLDVQMPEYDGFDVLEMLGADAPPTVVFVTAYDQYALKAFEAGALDYLLKPFDNARFLRALNRAKEQVAHRMHTHQTPGAVGTRDHLIIKSAGRISFLKIEDIDWIEAADYYASLHAGSKTHLLRRTMNELEQDLDQTMFCRIHRSTIVNLSRVCELSFDSDGEHEVVLADFTRLRMSRRYYKELQTRLGDLKRGGMR